MKINRRYRVDLGRGYTVDRFQFWVSYVVEAAIIGAGFYASWVFAQRYVSDNQLLWRMAIIGGGAVAFSELLRLVLAKAACTQKGFWRRFLAIAGMLLMCFVTTKSMAQVFDQVFSPRLNQVREATDVLKRAKGDVATLEAKKAAAEADVKPLSESVDGLDKQITSLNDSLQAMGEAPKPYVEKQAYKATCSDRKGRTWSCNKTRDVWKTPDYAGKPVIAQIDDAREKREEAAAKRDEAGKVVTAIDTEIADGQNKVTELESAKRKAVGESQLHSFTAMVFGKDPVDVTDGEIHTFLRLFVLLPALAISFASSLGMITAFRPVKPKAVAKPQQPKKQPEIQIANAQTLQRHIKATVAETLKRHDTDNVVHAFKGEKA
jgi:hypothetical protein